MLNKNVIRIIAIVMAALMVIGVFGAAISAFAIDGESAVTANPATGEPISWPPIIIGGVALIVAVICLALSKKTKKSDVEEDVDKDYINEEEVESGLNFFTSKVDNVIVQKQEEDDIVTENNIDEVPATETEVTED